MKYRYLSNFPAEDIGDREPGLTGANLMVSCASNAREQVTVEVALSAMKALSQGAKSDFISLMDEDCQLLVVGLDRDRLGGLTPDQGILETFFPQGLHFEILRVAVNEGVVFAEWLDEGVVATTGATYENLGTSVMEVSDSGKLTRYHEYVDVGRLYKATNQNGR